MSNTVRSPSNTALAHWRTRCVGDVAPPSTRHGDFGDGAALGQPSGRQPYLSARISASHPLGLPRGLAARREPTPCTLEFFSFGGATSSFSDRPARNHHRRRSSTAAPPPAFRLEDSQYLGVQPHQPQGPLSPIPGTPTTPMSLSRSPSPMPGGGWAAPGLGITSGRSSPARGSNGTPVMWESSRLKRGGGAGGGGSNGHHSFSTKNQSFFGRHVRRFSSSLPRFNTSPYYADKEKLGRGRWSVHNVPLLGRVRRILGRMGRKMKMRLLLLLAVLLSVLIFYNSPLVYHWRRSARLGGGEKFVILLGANVGGGVMDWKGAREYAIERDSVRNKKKYAARWGYELEIVDMMTKKRYSHEWRESWEKLDFVRAALKKYPNAEWFWWLDINTFIMEPSYSLQSHIFDELEKHVYRDINEYNPLNISHPFTEAYLDAESRSPVGDGRRESINLVLSQDCSGFSLGSFFVRRSEWTDRMLDIWWDPVAYEQRHMEWAHKEQDALEELYASHPWVRKHTAFLPQRMINSFPTGACDEKGNDTRIHYDQKDRDFLVNMAGCEWGRDCWAEMYHFRELGYYLNRSWWERFKEDLVAVIWFKLTGQKVRL